MRPPGAVCDALEMRSIVHNAAWWEMFRSRGCAASLAHFPADRRRRSPSSAPTDASAHKTLARRQLRSLPTFGSHAAIARGPAPPHSSERKTSKEVDRRERKQGTQSRYRGMGSALPCAATFGASRQRGPLAAAGAKDPRPA